MQKVKTVEATAAVVVGSKGKLGNLLGYSVISVMRACGKHGWTLPELKEALEAQVGKGALLVMPKEHTMKLALKRGRDTANGIDTGRKIAELGAKALEALRSNDAAPKKAKKAKKAKKPTATAPDGSIDEALAAVEAAA